MWAVTRPPKKGWTLWSNALASVNGWTGPYLKGGVTHSIRGATPYRYANPGANGGIEILSLG